MSKRLVCPTCNDFVALPEAKRLPKKMPCPSGHELTANYIVGGPWTLSVAFLIGFAVPFAIVIGAALPGLVDESYPSTIRNFTVLAVQLVFYVTVIVIFVKALRWRARGGAAGVLAGKAFAFAGGAACSFVLSMVAALLVRLADAS